MSGPPDIVEFLALDTRPLDGEYDYANTLGGVRGTWHRLWAALVMAYGLPGEDSEDTVKELLTQFSHVFGRALDAEEIARLRDHAQAHAMKVYGHLRSSPSAKGS